MPKKPKKISGVGSHAQKERNQKGNKEGGASLPTKSNNIGGRGGKRLEAGRKKKAVVEKAKEGNPVAGR